MSFKFHVQYSPIMRPLSRQRKSGPVNKRKRILTGQSNKDNTEKLLTYGTQDKEKQNINSTQYVLDTTICKQTQIM